MPKRFAPLFRQNMDSLTRAWVDAVYADRRTDLTSILSQRELVEHLPDFFDELARLLDEEAQPAEIEDAAAGLRSYAQGRFQKGVLIDEVARELMLMRDVLTEFLWREDASATRGEVREFSKTLRRASIFCDELIAQTIIIYAANLRPSVRTRGSVWPPPRGRRPS
ncbi:MAG: RsbRD N-terminal domain-containing protein [Acidobacteria bacterium]|nr:RsbRD N-terminal domain-containing protein [Acidobacteriota bacterium]